MNIEMDEDYKKLEELTSNMDNKIIKNRNIQRRTKGMLNIFAWVLFLFFSCVNYSVLIKLEYDFDSMMDIIMGIIIIVSGALFGSFSYLENVSKDSPSGLDVIVGIIKAIIFNIVASFIAFCVCAGGYLSSLLFQNL